MSEHNYCKCGAPKLSNYYYCGDCADAEIERLGDCAAAEIERSQRRIAELEETNKVMVEALEEIIKHLDYWGGTPREIIISRAKAEKALRLARGEKKGEANG